MQARTNRSLYCGVVLAMFDWVFDRLIVNQDIISSLSFFFFLSLSLLSPCTSPLSDSKPESLEAHKIKTAFFTHPTLTEIGRRLVSHYFLLTEEELAMWEEDPESFGNVPKYTGWIQMSRLIWTHRLNRHVVRTIRASHSYSSWSQQLCFGCRLYQSLFIYCCIDVEVTLYWRGEVRCWI